MSRERQNEIYHSSFDYRGLSPHLRHPRLNAWLREQLRRGLDDLRRRGLPPDVLEVGAGDGGFVESALAFGTRVTATEMSRPSIDRMNELYGANPCFQARFDPDGSLAVLDRSRFSAVLFASVLHHIPDYLQVVETAMENHLLEGGCLISLQDPLWYPSLPVGVRAVSDAAFASWRLTRGAVMTGIRNRARRRRGEYQDGSPADTVEYHAVRQGVDQEALRDSLEGRFEQVEILTYWSTQASPLQRIGESLPIHNTFAIVALGHCEGKSA